MTVVWATVHAFLFYYPGLRYDLFDSKGYREFGQYLIQYGVLAKPTYIFYIIPIFLIGLFDNFQNGLIAFFIFQSLVSLLATFALYKVAQTIYKSDKAGLCAALIFLLWWDNIQWNTALLTESIACSLTCFLFYRLTVFDRTMRHTLIIILILSACLLTRPTGIISVVATICFFLHRNWPTLALKPILKYAVLLVLFFSLAAGAFAMFSIWDFSEQYVRGNIITYMDSVEGMPSYFESLRLSTEGLSMPDTSHGPPLKILEFIYLNPVHFLKAGALKIFYLVLGIRPYYSSFHNFMLAGFVIAIYTMSFIGYTKIARKDIRLFIVVTIVINCLLVGISTVDWDNRFYIPMESAIVILAAGGATQSITLLQTKFRKSV